MSAESPVFRPDDEVTVTVTGRVVSAHAGGIVVEYLTATGWADRLVVRPDAPAVSVAVAPPPSREEVDRRIGAYVRTFVSAEDPEVRAAVLASAPYGGIDEAVA